MESLATLISALFAALPPKDAVCQRCCQRQFSTIIPTEYGRKLLCLPCHLEVMEPKREPAA